MDTKRKALAKLWGDSIAIPYFPEYLRAIRYIPGNSFSFLHDVVIHERKLTVIKAEKQYRNFY